MWAGQMLCEGFNWFLKEIIREERPNGVCLPYRSSHTPTAHVQGRSSILLKVFPVHGVHPSNSLCNCGASPSTGLSRRTSPDVSETPGVPHLSVYYLVSPYAGFVGGLTALRVAS